jgi:hypothetical protein
MRKKTITTKLTPEEIFLNNFKKLTKSEMNNVYKRKGIDSSKVEVFKAFTLDLINTIYDTFLGNDTINNESDIINHFNWCYNKVSNDYHTKWYKFDENSYLKDYFLEYFRENIYAIEESRNNDIDYFSFILEHEVPKEKFEINSFIELYELFIETPKKGRVLLK